jgi:hypothetical protein
MSIGLVENVAIKFSSMMANLTTVQLADYPDLLDSTFSPT